MERGSAILFHISSLKSDYGIGSAGKEAYRFVDFLSEAGQKYWQILPLTPTGYGDSPYQSCSLSAGNPYFIDLELLGKDGLLTKSELANEKNLSERVDYASLFNRRFNALRQAFSRFKGDLGAEYKNKHLYNYALFMSLKEKHGYRAWTEWDKDYKNADEAVLKKFAVENKREIEFWLFVQHIFFKQWNALKAYANGKNIKIIGDAPIYASLDSAEVCFERDIFAFDSNGNLDGVAGVPPDAFSSTGQLWGNPLYNWHNIQNGNFKWWKERIKNSLRLYDYLRIDHFRGFEQYYRIPYGDNTALNGEWLDAPGMELFKDIKRLPIIAEDLGLIDERVRALLDFTGYPGMKVLQYAFDGSQENEHKPSNYKKNCLSYTGTHDNNTLLGFVLERLKEGRKTFLREVNEEASRLRLKALDLRAGQKIVANKLIELVFASKASVCVIPLQDLMYEGEESRMNRPSLLSSDNWSYRFKGKLTKELSGRLKELTIRHKR